MKRKTSLLQTEDKTNTPQKEPVHSKETAKDDQNSKSIKPTKEKVPQDKTSPEQEETLDGSNPPHTDETPHLLEQIHQSNLMMAKQVKTQLHNMNGKMEHYVIRTINEVMEYLEDNLEEKRS